MCQECFKTCEDKHLKKCPVPSCRALKKVEPKEETTAEPEEKTSISKAAQKVLKPEEEVEDEEEDEQITEMEKQLVYLKKQDFKDVVEAAEKKLEELKKKKKKKAPVDTAGTKVVQTLANEQHR